MMDEVGNKAARAEIAMIKVVAPNVAQRSWTGRSRSAAAAASARISTSPTRTHGRRALRLADGPDEVHRETIAKLELGKHAAPRAAGSSTSAA